MLGAGAALAQSANTPVPAFPGNALGPSAVGPEGTTVLNRPRPDYDRLGMRLGSFLLYPVLGVSETYDSNVFATQSGAKSDFYTTANPSVSLQSDWGRHAVGVNAYGEFKWYADHSSEDVNNGGISVNGRYDIENGSFLRGEAGYTVNHEDRSSPDSVANIKSPTQYATTGAYLGYVRQEGRIGLNADTTITSYSYNNNSTSTGIIVPEVDRSRIEYVGALRASYEILPQLPYQAFVRVLGNERRYNSVDLAEQAATGVSARRNSHGWEADVGASMEITRLVTAEVYAGYLEQDYDASAVFATNTGPAFGGNVLWNVTPLTSIRGSFSQSVAETTLVSASSSSESNVQLGVEQELLRNVLLLGSVGYVRDDYVGLPGTSRTDNTYQASVGARYLLSRMWRVIGNVTFSDRTSTAPGGAYTRLVGTVGVQAGF